MTVSGTNHFLIFGERQVSAEERCVHMAIDFHLRKLGQHSVECVYVVDRAFESRAHGIDHQSGSGRVDGFLQFLRNHSSHGVGFDEPDFQVLQVAKAHIGVMCLVRDIGNRSFFRLLHEIFCAKIDAVVVAVGTAVRDDTPYILRVEAVKRRKELNHFFLKSLRGHVRRLVGHGISGIVEIDSIYARLDIPLVEIAQRRVLIAGITEKGLLGAFPDVGPFIQHLHTRLLCGDRLRTHEKRNHSD